jgi:hypothetical protein
MSGGGITQGKPAVILHQIQMEINVNTACNWKSKWLSDNLYTLSTDYQQETATRKRRPLILKKVKISLSCNIYP